MDILETLPPLQNVVPFGVATSIVAALFVCTGTPRSRMMPMHPVLKVPRLPRQAASKFEFGVSTSTIA